MLCLLALLAAGCKKGDKQPDEPTIDSHTELVAACRHIEGGGAAVTGGDGGTEYRVTLLNDTVDPNTGLPMRGTLRFAATQVGARRILFAASGTIHLKRELRIKNGRLTIDGQSAPGDGICIADYPLVIDGADNVIVRFLRVRLGDESKKEYDAVSVNNANGVVLDHLSCSWSVDECVSCYGNTNFTMQYCFITESLRNSVHGKGQHGYGGIWGGTNATFHHNLLAHHDSRNPRFDHDYVDNAHHGPIDYVNNVVFNWGGNSTYGGESVSEPRQINMVANYYKYGPATSPKSRLLNATTYCTNCTSSGKVQPGSFYLANNYMYGSSSVTTNNWAGVVVDGKGTATVDDCKASSRWTSGLTPLKNEQTAEAAYETVLAKAGCSLVRDAVDLRIVEDVRNGIVRNGAVVTSSTVTGSVVPEKGGVSKGGLIDTPSDVGGWPELKTGTAPTDTDLDGMPDEWEEKYGLDPKDPSDAKKITLVTGHTNLDVYMCHKVAHLYE